VLAVRHGRALKRSGSLVMLITCATAAGVCSRAHAKPHLHPQSGPASLPANATWRIAFERNMIFPGYMLDAPTPINIFVLEVNKLAPEMQITRDGLSTSPIWLPDGERILFVRGTRESFLRKDRKATATILIVDLKDGKPRQIASFKWLGGHDMALAPDGRTLAFDGVVPTGSALQGILHAHSTANNISSESSINLLNLEAGSTPRVFAYDGFSPSWSPDGTEIAYTCARPAKSGESKDSICIIRVAEPGEAKQVAEGASKPSWSPDGAKIAYITASEKNTRLVVTNADGSGAVSLTDGKHEVQSAVWSPDGKRIAFTEVHPMDDEVFLTGPLSSQKVPRVFVAGLDGKRIGPLGEKKSLWCRDLSWAPDGQSIAAVCQSGLRDPDTRRQRFESNLYVFEGLDGVAVPRKIADKGVEHPAFSPQPSHWLTAAVGRD
jgi:Tol biopolymer transport system component